MRDFPCSLVVGEFFGDGVVLFGNVFEFRLQLFKRAGFYFLFGDFIDKFLGFPVKFFLFDFFFLFQTFDFVADGQGALCVQLTFALGSRKPDVKFQKFRVQNRNFFVDFCDNILIFLVISLVFLIFLFKLHGVQNDFLEFFRDGVDNGLVVFVTINKVIDFGVFKFLIKSVVLFGRAGLLCQRFKPKFQFVQNVFYARKAFVGAIEFSFGLVLLRLEVGNARGFFKDAASVDGFRLNNLRDASLPDDAVTFAADTGVVQKRDDVFKAAFLLVDKVFADAASVDFSS